MAKKAEFKLTVPIVKFYDDPEDNERFFIEGLASDTSVDKFEGAMEDSAIYEMAGDFADGIVVDVEHNHGWADEIGDVEEALVLDEAPADFPNASPPILWTKLKVDKLLSHGKDLHYLLTKGESLGLSIEGYMNKFTFDEDEILRRVSVTWKRLAVTRTPANENAWLSSLVLSAQEAIKGGDVRKSDAGTDGNTNSISIRMRDYQQEEQQMPDNETPNEEGNQEEGLDLGRVLEAVGGLSDDIVALSSSIEAMDGRIVTLEEVEPPDPEPQGDQVVLSAVLERLDSMDARMVQIGQPQLRSGEDLLNLAMTRSGRRGMSAGDFQVSHGADLDEELRLAIEASDMDRAKGVFWNRLDAQRGFH